MSKNVIRGGHNFQATGARGIVDETTEDRKIYPIVINYLRQDGNTALDGTPSNCDTGTDLAYGVNIANSNKVDYFASVHLNCGGGHGCEVIYGSEAGRIIAQRICDNLAKLGFTNRGAKPDVRGLYEIRRTNMVANIIEVFFSDSQSDVDLYNRVGIDAIGKAIAEGIVGHSIGSSSVSQPIQSQPTQPQPSQPTVDNNVLSIQRTLNRLKIANLSEDGIMGNMTRGAIIKFQSICGIDQDGIWGNQTQNCADQILSKPLCGLPYVQRIPTRYIQWRLSTGIDGIFGSGTARVVMDWQSDNDLSADGIVGQMSWSKIIG